MELKMKKSTMAFSAVIALVSAISAHAAAWYPSTGAGWTVRSAKIDISTNQLAVRADRPAALGGGVIEFDYAIDYNSPSSIARANTLLALALSAQNTGTPTYFKVSNETAIVATPSNQSGTILTAGIMLAIQAGLD